MISNSRLIQAIRWANDLYDRADQHHYPRPRPLRSVLDDARPDAPMPANLYLRGAFIVLAAVNGIENPRARQVLALLGTMKDGEPAHSQRSVAAAFGISAGTVNRLAQIGYDALRANPALNEALDALNKSLPESDTTRIGQRPSGPP